MRRLIKPLAAAALGLGSLGLTPTVAQAHNTDSTAVLLCTYFKPHPGDFGVHAHTYPENHPEYEVFNCTVQHPGGGYHPYFVMRWWNDELTWSPGAQYCEDSGGHPYDCSL